MRLTEAGRSLRERASSVPGRILAASLLSAAEAKDMAAGIKSLRDSLTRDSPKGEVADLQGRLEKVDSPQLGFGGCVEGGDASAGQ